MEAVKMCASVLKFVPPHHKDYDMYFAACKNDLMARLECSSPKIHTYNWYHGGRERCEESMGRLI